MKKLILLASIACFAVTASTSVASAQSSATKTVTSVSSWTKSTTGYWVGSDRLLYKLNASDKSIWVSKNNGTSWDGVKSGQWQDKSSKWMKIDAGKLKTSADQGATWTIVADGSWQGGDGKWQMFDASWNLMTKK